MEDIKICLVGLNDIQCRRMLRSPYIELLLLHVVFLYLCM